MVTTVQLENSLCTRLVILWSVTTSMAEVASSRIKSLEFLEVLEMSSASSDIEESYLRIARPRQSSCLSPTLRLPPPSVISVSSSTLKPSRLRTSVSLSRL